MRLLRGVYEGPSGHGILHLAASLREAHAVLRALPGENYFPFFHADRRRDGVPAPLTLSPVWRRPDDTRAPGDLPRDLLRAAGRNPEARTILLARSEAALLSGEEPPGELTLPSHPETGRSPRLLPCGWQVVGMGETEAAELALEDLVRAHAAPQPRTAEPTANLFGPMALDRDAEAEYAEAGRLLGLMGIGVNARVPLGAGEEELSRLTRAWVNVVLYREAAESATLYLQDEFGIPRVTTPMIGTSGTGAALRAAARICEVDARTVRQAIWGELSRTAKLPWYARLAPPEVFEDKSVFIFGDFTYALGLGYALSREVGLRVAGCGTYMTHLARDFLFHAGTFTDAAFAADDPEEVARRIERSDPDLLVGTELEEEVAGSLGIPFLPFCPPAGERSFAPQPLMGYAGSSVLADALDAALRQVEEPPEASGPPEISWTEEALEELAGVPVFLRGRARRLAEERARELGSPEVTRGIFLESRF